MISRVGLLIGATAAATTLAVAVALGAIAPLLASDPPPAPAVASADPGDPMAAPTIQVDTVYVPAPVAQQVIVTQVAPAGGEEDGSGAESDGESD